MSTGGHKSAATKTTTRGATAGRTALRGRGFRMAPTARVVAMMLAAGGVLADAHAQRALGAAWLAQKNVIQGTAQATGRLPNGQPVSSLTNPTQQRDSAQMQRSLDNLNLAARGIAAQQAAQEAARLAALNADATVPDGLVDGGLKVDTHSLTAGWLNAKAPVQSAAGGRTVVGIEQTDEKAILNWESFNVGRNTTVKFDQKGGTKADGTNGWIALNRINDPSGKPSQIAGQIQADGSVYIVNRNGIVFNGSAQVDTRTLIASSLALSDAQFMRGINNPTSMAHVWAGDTLLPAFGDHAPTVTPNFDRADAWAPTAPTPGTVSVQAGARIQVEKGDKLMLLGTQVSNAGRLQARDGQVILAAGEQVWLSEDVNGVRGLDVAVSGPMPYLTLYSNINQAVTQGPIYAFHDFQARLAAEILPALDARAAALDYNVLNTGTIQSDRGNITLQARDVRQMGVLTASTALNNRDGSIRLRAWAQGQLFGGAGIFEGFNYGSASWSAGTLTMGEGSVTRVRPDAEDTSQIEATDLAMRYTPGSISLYGKLIDLRPGSLTMAPSGLVDIVAATVPYVVGNKQVITPGFGARANDTSRIYIDSGAVVSTAGLQEVAVPIERNFIEVDLRINELRDSPLLRDSWLRGQKLVVDRRASGVFAHGPMSGVLWGGDAGAWQGTPLADVSGWIGVGKTDLQELSATGGSINLKSGGDLIARPGSLLDISGGSVRYAGGWNTTSKIRSLDGRLHTMANASPDLVYDGIAGRFISEHARWNVSETFLSPLLSGKAFEAGYTEGRGAGAMLMYVGQGVVLEGELAGGTVVGERQQGDAGTAKAGRWTFGGGSNLEWPWNLGALTISDAPEQLGSDFTRASALDTRWRQADGSTASWFDAGMLERSGLGSIQLAVGGNFTLAQDTELRLAPRTAFAIIASAGNTSRLDFRIDGTLRSAGGSVVLANQDPTGGSVTLGAGARIDVGGQWHNETLNGRAVDVLAKDGGTISLEAAKLHVEGPATLVVSGGGRGWREGSKKKLDMGDAGSIRLDGVAGKDLDRLDLQAFAAGSGGSLALVLAQDQLSIGGPPLADAWRLPTTLYGDRGFRAVSLEVPGPVDIADGTRIGLVPLGWDMVGVDHEAIASGSRLGELLTASLLRPEQRLARAPASLSLSTMGQGDLRVGRDASIRVDTGGTLSLNGTAVDVRGTVVAPAGAISVSAATTLTLAEGASLLARGAAVVHDDARGRRVGRVLDGGRVTLRAADLALETGSLIDVSGTQAVLDGAPSAWHESTGLEVASHGGSIAVTGKGLIAGRLVARAGGAGAHGGSLSLTHSDPSVQGDPGQLLVRQFCGIVGFCDPSQVIGVDFSKVLEDYGMPGFPRMVLTQAFIDALSNSLRAGLSVTDAALQAGGGTIDFAAYGLDDAALDGFRDGVGIDLRAIQPTRSLLTVRPGAMASGGFADLALKASGRVELGDVHLSAGRSITVDGMLARAPGESAGASLVAPYIVLQRTGSNAKAAPADELAGQLRLQADTVDVYGGRNAGAIHGPASLRGFAQTTVTADELRFTVVTPGSGAEPTGAREATLDVDGSLRIEAGQVYPSTGVDAKIVASRSIEVHGNGAMPDAPLSAGGALTLTAPVIEQHGVLRAPFGQLTLAAGERLVLGAGSLTSVSGDGLLVPYGALLNNEYWTGPFKLEGERGMSAPPEKRIVLQGASVDVAAGSVIDIRGGGDMVAREFVPGSGGSHDILTLPGAYAVVPGHASAVAPGLPARAGHSLWLAGGNGLAAGWYTLLPASYAALPGAFLVLPTGAPATLGTPPAGTAIRADGSVVMAGREGNALAGSADARSGWWQVMNGAQLRQYSQYHEAQANTFFASEAFKLTQYRLTGIDIVTPRLPMDAGAVVLRASQQLQLGGTLQARGGSGPDGETGRGGLVDIVADKIAIVGAGQDPSALRAEGFLVLASDMLSNFGAGSLLVGGTRSGDALGLALDIEASEILVRNDAGSALGGPEIILAATDAVKVADGSVIRAVGKADGRGTNLIVKPRQKAVYADPDGQLDDNRDGVIDQLDAADDVLVSPSRDWGALLRLSNAGTAQVLRSAVDATQGGMMQIGAGATLAGGASLLIDATRTTLLAPSARLSGEALSVASGRIGLGGGSEGLVLGAGSLAQLADTRELTLRSYGSIDFHGNVDFGGAGLRSVVLDAQRLSGQGGDVVVDAALLTLSNSSGASVGGNGTGLGSLRLTADELRLGSGEKRVDGFASIEFGGRQRVLAVGSGSLDAGAIDLVLRTPVLTGQRGARQAVTTTGALTLAHAPGAASAAEAEDSLGTSLSLTGGSVGVDGRIVALGGSVSLQALTGDLQLAAGSRIDVGGFAKRFFDVAAYADAGRITLQAGQGHIVQAAGSTLALAAHADGGNAGTLSVETAGAGTVSLDGELLAQAGAGGQGGSFALNIAALPGFGALAARLNAAGFDAARDFRVRSGDVTVDGRTQVADFRLSADQGRVTLAGAIDARSTYGGRIAVAGGGGVTMTNAASLRAGATDAELGSGRITLEASGGQLDLQGGVIDVGGGEGGRVRLRARQNAGHDEVAVTALNATVTGARSAVLEGVTVYDSPSVDAVKAQAVADAQRFASHAGAVARRLGLGPVSVMPGIEIRSDGDLTLGTDWNLYGSFGTGLREGGLTLRAAGNLLIGANLSDGFDAAGRSGVLQDAASWDLRLVAGADLSAANALSVRQATQLAAGSGNVVVGTATAGSLVRTGTGDLQLAAGRDLDLAHQASVIYTAGRSDSTVWADFTTLPSSIELQGPSWDPSIGTVALPTAAYGVQGGNLELRTGGDIRSVAVAGAEAQFFGEWLRRLGRKEPTLSGTPGVVTVDMPFQPGEQATWFVDYAKFNQGVGALGGGNVTVQAGGGIDDLLVAQPTHGRVRGGRTAGEAMTLVLGNGGAMKVTAEGAIRGGQYYIGRGEGHITAGEMTAGARAQAPVLAIGDSVLGVTTRGDLNVSTVADPLMTDQRYTNAYQGSSTIYGGFMSGYTARSAVDLRSVGGDLVLGTADIGSLKGQDTYPSKLALTALSGSVSNETGSYNPMQSDDQMYYVPRTGLLFMMPSAQTELRVLADRDVRLGEIVMSRSAPDMLPRPFNPMRDWVSALRRWMIDPTGGLVGTPQSSTPELNWLADDHAPSRIYARSGDIVRRVSSKLVASEQLWLRAGEDIRGLRLDLRNNHADEVSMLAAGKDVIGLIADPQLMNNPNTTATIGIQGPGGLLVSAGRDVYNVNAISQGNIQRWDANNFPEESSRVQHLPDEGASITVMAGLQGKDPDYAAFVAAYLDPTRVAAMPAHLVSTLADGTRVPRYLLDAQETRAGGQEKTVQRGLVSYMKEMTGESFDPLAAWARFRALPALAQEVFARRVFQQELREAGRNQNTPDAKGEPVHGGYNRGYAAIETLFPGSDWKGSVLADSMTLRTMRGGDIDVLAPGGHLQAASLTRIPAAGEGLVTLAGGHIGLFADDSVVVNRSRILAFVPEATQRGSDMIIWSSNGDVDAGRGAKTVRVPSRPIVKTDVDGMTRVTERSDMSGSGIGTVGDGDVDLMAPKGTINAGDAGIRFAGNLNLAALHVLNADNIQGEGDVTGLPVVAAVDIGALTNASAATAQATAAAQEVLQRERAAARQALPSVFTVRVLGFGSEAPERGGAALQPAPSAAAATAPRYDATSPVRLVGNGQNFESRGWALLTEPERRQLRQER
ncbi:filamentous haemagglutinin family protein [Variovorax sp. UMC13]|uniref:filamentous haemagglutinin family protein n=1 Tax=Variovorax sp. UMC13 TaxID=1862326 RepID=UPI001600C030|nr:filamentous haemagglutinin family protein [Variovorax sp. UMC13]